jgi:hypothetical protein
VYTDHKALKWLLNLQDPISRLTRWAINLSEYDFTVEHLPNIRIRHADALSRCVNVVGRSLILTKDIIQEEQAKMLYVKNINSTKAFG